jgi:membrane protease YdiL (CAAX protease family)
MAWLLAGLGLALLLIGAMAGPPLGGVLLMAGLLSLIVGLAAGAGYQIVSRRARPGHQFHGPSPLILLGLQFVLVNTLSLVLFVIGLPGPDTPIGFFVASVVLLGGYLAVIWLFAIRSGAMTWHVLGLRPGSIGRFLGDVGTGAGVLLLVAFGASIAGGLLARLLDTGPPEVVPTPDTPAEILLVALGAVLLIPIGEELFFRGYAVTAWLHDLGERAALIRSTLFFAFVHIATLTAPTFFEGARQALLVVVVVAPVGYALGWLFVRRGLLASIAGHAAYNGFGILVLILAESLPAPG